MVMAGKKVAETCCEKRHFIVKNICCLDHYAVNPSLGITESVGV